MKKVTYTTLHGLPLRLRNITEYEEWFLETIEKTPRDKYIEIFKSPLMNKRRYMLIRQDEKYTDIIVTDVYGKKTFIEIKEDLDEI